MKGKILMGGMLGVVALLGAGMWYYQNYAYYDVFENPNFTVRLTRVGNGFPAPILTRDLTVLNAMTSPLKFRACFTVQNSIPMLTETFEIYENPTPLRSPGWFECFDYARITEDLDSGSAIAFLGERDFSDGVDRVVAVYPDGRAFAWNQLNDKYAN